MKVAPEMVGEMPGKPQNPNSWFYGTRLRAGFPNAALLAQRLGVPKGTVYQWEHGNRPSNRIMLQLATILDVTERELVEALYRETLGDPCPCGCGGKKVLSDSPTAHKLVIKLPCAECGKERNYPQGKRNRHRKFCDEHRVKRIPFTCIGYQDHSATRYARTCPRTIYLRPSDVNARQRLKERFPTSRFDPSSRTYQCNSCRGAGGFLLVTEKALGSVVVKKYLERIKSRQDRIRLLREYYHRVNPNFKATRKAQKRGRRSFARNAKAGKTYPNMTRANLVRRWSGKVLPERLRLGICIACDKITMTMNGSGNFHWSCHQKWEGTPEGKRFQSLKVQGLPSSLPQRNAGRPVTEESLKRSFSYVVQHYFGRKSFREIGNVNGLDHKSVEDRIKSIIERLPVPQLLESRFQRAIQLLLDAATRSSSHSAEL